uniref:Retrotransposon Copia-like N-terminal domain-containing protein n=1 Tax=Hordeum vulgare subsp. vulgare TaxID=112509 RepID=A0A8I6YP25_HORVV
MTTTATASASAGFLPASLVALLSRPTDAAAVAAPINTRSVGSVFSAASFSPPPPAAAPPVHVLPLVPSSGTPSAPATIAALSTLLVAASTLPATTPAMAPYFDANHAHPPPPIGAYGAPAPVTAATAAYTPPAVFTPGSLPAPFQFGHLITTKLSWDNYVFWRAQVLPLLGSHYLLGYVDGSYLCPPAVVDSVNGPVYNPAHGVWTGHDQANLSAIQGSLTPEVAEMLVFAKTSHEAWTILERSFALQSQARSSALRRQLGECEKLDGTATPSITMSSPSQTLWPPLANLSPTLSSTPTSSAVLTRSMMALWRSSMSVATRLRCRRTSSTRIFFSPSSALEARHTRGRGLPSANATYKAGRGGSGPGAHSAPSGKGPPAPLLLAPPPASSLGGVVLPGSASSVDVWVTMPLSAAAASRTVSLASTTTTRTRTTMSVRRSWLISQHLRSSRDTRSPIPSTPTGTWTVGLRITSPASSATSTLVRPTTAPTRFTRPME